MPCVEREQFEKQQFNKSVKSKNNIRTVSLVDNKADFYASNIVYSEKGISFIINSKYGKRKIITNLYGEFSVTNILLSIASLAKNKSEYKFYADNVINLKAAEGRMNMYFKKNYPPVFIDFSHTPDSIEKVLNLNGYKAILETLNTKTPILASGSINIMTVTNILETGISGVAVSDEITQDPNTIKAYNKILNASSTVEKRYTFK